MSSNRSRIIRAKELAEQLSVSRVTIWRWEREGLLPRKRRIGPNVVGWDSAQIRAFLAAKDPDSDQTVQEVVGSENPSLKVSAREGVCDQ